MSLSDLASLGSFVSGIAVLFSFVFLSLQMRQNTKAVRAAASQAHTMDSLQLMNPIIAERDVAHMWSLGLENVDALDKDDKVRFLLTCTGLFRVLDSQWQQRKLGQLTTEHWHAIDAQLRYFLKYPGIQEYWRVRQHWHSPEFRALVDGLPREEATHGPFDIGLGQAPSKKRSVDSA